MIGVNPVKEGNQKGDIHAGNSSFTRLAPFYS